jgi:hypothetical protein
MTIATEYVQELMWLQNCSNTSVVLLLDCNSFSKVNNIIDSTIVNLVASSKSYLFAKIGINLIDLYWMYQ